MNKNLEITKHFKGKICKGVFKKLDGSERSENLGVTLTTYIGKKKASISSTNLSENNLFELVTRCIDSTKATPEDEYNSLPDQELHFKGEKNLEL